MPISSTGVLRKLPFAAARTQAAAAAVEIERHVIWLFDEFRDSVLRYVLSFGLSMQDGEEVTQEVFLALFRHLQRGRPQQNIRGWLFCVAHNLAIKQRYSNQRCPPQSELQAGVTLHPFDPSPNPEEQAVFAQRRERLLAVVRALPEQDQCCLRLRAEGLRYREIAQVLGISLGAVSVSLTRSLARLSCGDGR